MSDEMRMIQEDHIDFTRAHMRLGLDVKHRVWTGLTVKECEELAGRLSGTTSDTLNQLRAFCEAAARWAAKHPEALEGHGEVSA